MTETDNIQQPAIITSRFEKRPATNDDGKVIPGKEAYREICQFKQALDAGKLDDPESKYTAHDRYLVAKGYEKYFAQSEATGTVDSTQKLNIVRSSKPGDGNTDRTHAWNMRLALEARLGERDRIIIRSVCGQGHSPAEGVRLVSTGYKHTVWARFREALDSLCEAFEAVRKQPGVFSMERRP